MRSAVSGSLSETADRLPSSSDSSIGDASDGDDAHSHVEAVVAQTDAGVNAATAPQELKNIAAQRTRSWDDSVEEGMARIDADTPQSNDALKGCATILWS